MANSNTEINLASLYSEYREKEGIGMTEEQEKYVEKLHGKKLSLDEINERVFIPVSDEKKMTPTDISSVIFNLERVAGASEKQIELIRSNFSSDHVSELLRRNIDENMKNLTISEVRFILSSSQKFKYWKLERPLFVNIDYEHGYQESDLFEDNKMYYLKFYDFLMIDFDKVSINHVREKLSLFSPLTFRIYSTYNGFHAFLMSASLNHRSSKTRLLLEDLGCDPYYIKFSHNLGFKVRLNPKKGRDDEKSASVYVETMGTRICDWCEQMAEIHDQYIQQFSRN